MAESFPIVDEPWGDDGDLYVALGHIDPAEAFARFDRTNRSLYLDSLEAVGVEVGDIVHAYATQALYPPDGWEIDEWWLFHSQQGEDPSTVPVTLLDLEGWRRWPELPDQRPDDPFGPPEPTEWLAARAEERAAADHDPTLGGRILRHNGQTIA